MKRVTAAVHVHSEWSYDARWSLAKLASAFERRGCSVILAAEHDRDFSEERFQEYRRDCAAVSTDKFLIVPGIEYSDPTNTTHVLVWGDVPFIGEGLPTGDLLAAAHALGGIAVLAHPWRKDAWSTFDPEWTQYLFGIELWNRKSDGWCPEKRVALTLKRSSLLPFVSLDFHRPRQFFPLRMQLVLDGPLREQSVLDALRARRCRPRLFGLSALGFTSGAPYAAARIAERTRASVMATARRMALRRRLRNAEPRNPDPRDAVES